MRLLLSCGEASGDLYAGALTRALRSLQPDVQVAGLGGPGFADAGGDVLVDYRGLSVTGFTEWGAKLPQLLGAKSRLVAFAREHRPQALVVIDYDGFNSRLSRDVHALGIPVIHYISPQVWAWRTGRLERIRKLTKKVLVIFPFEEHFYREAGVPVEFVGHPLVDLIQASAPRPDFLASLGLDPGAPVVGVLPGSRTSELRRLLPTLVEAARRIRASVPAAQFLFARAPHLDDRLFAPARALTGSAMVEHQTDSVLAASDVVLTASGTATVQTALHDKPMVVVYRVSPLEYSIGRRFVKVDTFAMVNLIAGHRLVPELIQDDFTPEAVAREAVSMLTDHARAAAIRDGLAQVRSRLGGPGGSLRAAQAILDIVRGV